MQVEGRRAFADLSTERRSYEEAGVNRRMHLGILVTCFVPLLHNRLSRQLGQLSTPPPTLFSLSAPLFFRHLVLYPFLFLSFFLRLPLSLSSSCFSPSIPSLLSHAPFSRFYSNPISLFLLFFFDNLRSFCCLSFLFQLIPLCHLLVARVGRYWKKLPYQQLSK